MGCCAVQSHTGTTRAWPLQAATAQHRRRQRRPKRLPVVRKWGGTPISLAIVCKCFFVRLNTMYERGGGGSVTIHPDHYSIQYTAEQVVFYVIFGVLGTCKHGRPLFDCNGKKVPTLIQPTSNLPDFNKDKILCNRHSPFVALIKTETQRENGKVLFPAKVNILVNLLLSCLTFLRSFEIQRSSTTLHFLPSVPPSSALE